MSKKIEESENLLKYIQAVEKVLGDSEEILKKYIRDEGLKETGGYRGDGSNDLSESRPRFREKSWKEIISELNSSYSVIGNKGDTFGFKAAIDALLGRINSVGKMEEPKKPKSVVTDEEFLKALEIVLTRCLNP